MKIAQFTSSLIEPLGGAEQYCLALARHQKRDGHDVTVLTGWIDDGVAEALRADGIAVTVLPTKRPYSPDQHGSSAREKIDFHAREVLDSRRRTPAMRAIEEARFDVLHVHRFAGFGTSVLRVRGARVVHTVHDFTLVHTSASLVGPGAEAATPSLLQSIRSRMLLAGLSSRTIVIFPTARTRERHDEWGLDTARFDSVVVPHGWPTAGVPTPTGEVPDDSLGFLFLGKLSDHKGLPTLLEAWGDGIPGARLRVAGDGPLLEDVLSNGAVEPLGWLGDDARARALAVADVLVFPSTWPENFPIVVAESMLAGVPVLTTTVASPPLVDHGESGLVVGPGASALRAGMESLVADRMLVSRLSAGAEGRAAGLDMAAHVTAIVALYATGAADRRSLSVR
jgi:glycosyltransferase involved in cell wall biosynthesis